jgi:hypothetical protein
MLLEAIFGLYLVKIAKDLYAHGYQLITAGKNATPGRGFGQNYGLRLNYLNALTRSCSVAGLTKAPLELVSIQLTIWRRLISLTNQERFRQTSQISSKFLPLENQPAERI